jgi:ABC-type nitrate/sulfonate/bicarbonate transport system ATPase subunit
MAIVAINDLEVYYGTRRSRPILNIHSLEIDDGEIVAICGRNHYGKTTLLKVLAGVLRDVRVKDSFEVLYGGKTLAEFGRQNISYVPQAFAATLFPWMSIDKNLKLRLIAQGAEHSVVERDISKISAACGHGTENKLYEHLGFTVNDKMKTVSQLSGGQQQRLTLLRALLPAPNVLLLDEPFSALDAFEGARFREKIRKYIEECKITTVFVTHDLHAAVHFADRVVVLNRLDQVSVITNIYPVGIRKLGPNLDPSDADALVNQIRSECDV